MAELSNRAAYLKGLADGLKIDKEKPEGNLIDEIIKLLGEMAEEIEGIDDEVAFVEDRIDDVEESLDIIAEEVFDDECDCDDVYTLVCDKCGTEIDFTEEDLDDIAEGNFVCPECGTTIEIDFEECDCGHDCDCGCDCEK